MRNRTVVLIFSLFFPIASFTISSIAQTNPKPQHGTPANVLQLREGWALQSSCKVEKKGEVISTPQFTAKGWYAASVPTTVVAALVKHKVYPDPMFGMNLRSFPGVNYPIGTNFFCECEGTQFLALQQHQIDKANFIALTCLGEDLLLQ